MDLQLNNAVAFVAASTKGLGRAIAETLAKEGARVVCSARTESDVTNTRQVLEEIGGKETLGVVCDLTKKKDVEHAIAKTVHHFGQLDMLVVNAGGPPVGTWATLSDEQWEEAFHITLMSAIWLIRAAETHLRASNVGSITIVSSTSVLEPIPTLVASNSVRLAVSGLAKSLSREFAPDIRVNSILPGRFLTDRTTARVGDYPGGIEQFVKDEAASIPMQRFGECPELGQAVAFLASPMSAYTTGATLAVDGGIIHRPI